MELPTTETLRLSRGASNGAELRIVLHRPERMNAWTHELGRELLAAFELARTDASVRAVTITGAGRAFSSGADLKAGFDPTPEGHPDVQTPLDTIYHPIMTAIRELPKPVLAGVNGPAVGIGCSLALACDLVLAADPAYFLLAFVNIGLVPDGGASAWVPARAGFGRAARMALLGERIPAAEAHAWGLVDRLVSAQAFPEELDALAERLATGPTRSYAATKRQLNARVYAGLQAQLDLEAATQQEMASGADFAEGVQAFLDKRPADFRGL